MSESTFLYAEHSGNRYKLQLNRDGHPYVLRRRNHATKHWNIAWADWHKGMPTGERAEVMATMGYRWINTEHPCRWDIAA